MKKFSRIAAAIIVLVGPVFIEAGAGPAVGAASHELKPAPVDWRSHVLAPTRPDVYPVRIASTSGSVENATALTKRHSGTTRLIKRVDGPDPVVVLDYGRAVGGFPFFDVAATEERPVLHAAYSEALDFLTAKGDVAVLTGAFGEDLNRFDDYTVDRPGRITNPRVQGAERFQEIRLTSPGVLSLAAVGIHFSSLRTPYRGHFVSSSEMLNRVWYESAYTVQLDSLPADSEPGVVTPPVIVDGAKRDRKVWGGDLLTAAQNVYYSTGASEYVRGSLSLLARRQSPEGEISAQATQSKNDYWSAAYSMTWVSALAEYYHFTGDLQFVRQVWPVLVRELTWNAGQVDSRGLLITHGYTWHPVDGQMFDGAVTVDNALYFHVLTAAAELADAIGAGRLAVEYRGRARRIKAAVNHHLFDARTGVYDISDTRRGPVAQDANALAVLYGLAPAERVQRILQVLRSRLWTTHGPLAFTSDSGLLGAYSSTGHPDAAISPFASSLELWARMSAGDTDGAMHLLRELWAPMADPTSNYYTGTTWEILNSSGEPGFVSVTSLSHAWSAGAAPALSEYVLGLRPATAGFRTWIVAPQPAALQWAEGQVPTPRGALAVRWAARDAAFTMDVSAPNNSAGTIVVPWDRRQATVRVNGHVVWKNGRFKAEAGIALARRDSRNIYLTTSKGGAFAVRAGR